MLVGLHLYSQDLVDVADLLDLGLSIALVVERQEGKRVARLVYELDKV